MCVHKLVKQLGRSWSREKSKQVSQREGLLILLLQAPAICSKLWGKAYDNTYFRKHVQVGEIRGITGMGLFLGSLFCSIGLCVSFDASIMLF